MPEAVATLQAAKRRRLLGEAALGYLFVAPAALIALIFQLIPVVYGLFLSTQGGIAFPEGFVGLQQFIKATGSLAYMVALAIALVFLLVALRYLRLGREAAALPGGQTTFTTYLLPAVIAAPATISLLGMVFLGDYSYAAYPLIGIGLALVIYTAIIRSAKDSANVNYVIWSWLSIMLLILSALLIYFVMYELQNSVGIYLDRMQGAIAQAVADRNITGVADKRYTYMIPLGLQYWVWGGVFAFGTLSFLLGHQRSKLVNITDRDTSRQRFILTVLGWIFGLACAACVIYLLSALELLRGSQGLLAKVPPETLTAYVGITAQQLIERISLYPQVATVLLGTMALGLAYFLWQAATRRETTLGMISTFLLAILLIIGGWLFIGELPNAAAQGDPDFYASLLRTVTYAFGTVPTQIVLGMLIAYMLFYEVKAGKGLYRVIFFIPYIAPTVATAAVFSMIFAGTPNGIINQLLQSMSIPAQQWLRDPRGIFEIIAAGGAARAVGTPALPDFLVGPSLPLVSAIIYSVWVFSGYNAVILLSGLGAVPKELFEAAQVDGANRWNSFRNITLPMISPTIFFLTVLGVVGTFSAFNHIYVLRTEAARRAMDVTTVYIYEIIRQPDGIKPMPYAAALSFLLFGIILILTVIQNRLSKDVVFYG